MNEKHKLHVLEGQVALLKKEKGLALTALEAAVAHGGFQTSLSKLADPTVILRETGAKVRDLVGFKQLCFYMVNEDDSDFVMVHCDPEADSEEMDREVSTLIEDRTFALALQQARPMVITSSSGRDRLLLHSLKTASRIRGIFVGFLGQEQGDILDTALSLFSFVLIQAANDLESFELYRYIHKLNHDLKRNVEKLADSERQLKRHHQQLEEEVAVQTQDLARSNQKLKREIAERRVMEQALRQAEETYRTIFENAMEGIYQSTPEGRFLKVNPAMARMLGYDSPVQVVSELRDLAGQLYVDPEQRQEVLRLLRETGALDNHEVELRRRDGRHIWISISAVAITDAKGDIERIEGLAEDITERRLSDMQLRRKATYDELTNVPNRFLFQDRLQQMLAQADRLKTTVAILYVDLDEFKAVNDHHGHFIGDLVLQEAARRLASRIRRSDTVARLGGDEFAVLVNNVGRVEDVAKVAKDIIASISVPYRPERDIECTVGASVGICLYPCDGNTLEEIMQRADAAMYKAKQMVGNSHYIYDATCVFRNGSAG